MKTLLNLLLKTKYHQRQNLPKSVGGFTMIELLVGMIIAFLIITPMLAFVVDILNRDIKEQVKANTEQDIQAAVDYITQDMSQAVHIYTPKEVICFKPDEYKEKDSCKLGENNPIPIPLPANPEPILVFWKRAYAENAVPAVDIGESDPAAYCKGKPNNCDDTFIMSLVAYYLISNDNSEIWCQPAGGNCKRIARVEIEDGIKYGNGYINDDAIDKNPTDGDGVKELPGRGFNPENIGNMKEVEKLSVGKGDLPNPDVLVNYIEVFELERVSTSQKLATIKLVGNSLRRSKSDATCVKNADGVYEPQAYCPVMTVQVGGRSGFGSSE